MFSKAQQPQQTPSAKATTPFFKPEATFKSLATEQQVATERAPESVMRLPIQSVQRQPNVSARAQTSNFKPQTSNYNLPIQAKLTVGQPNDKYEQEADAMADKVVQRWAMPRAIAATSTITPFNINSVQRACAACEKEDKDHIQRKESGEMTASPSVESRLSATKGGGNPLPESTRTQMESSIGADFSNVRVHTGGEAVQLSQDLSAHAFTHGSDVYFNSGKFSPDTEGGRHLLAHELTHTVQQGMGSIRRVASTYSTKGITVTGLDDLAKQDYWIQKLGKDFKITTSAGNRFSDKEEQNAVFSVAWQLKPITLTKDIEELVKIPNRVSATASKLLFYKIIFKKGTPQNELLIEFISENTEEGKIDAYPSTFTPQGHNLTINAPQNYFDGNADEKNQLLFWIENTAPDDVNHFLTTSVSVPVKGKSPKVKNTRFLLKGKVETRPNKPKPKRIANDVAITHFGDVNFKETTAQEGYNTKDIGDKIIEEAKTKVGTIIGLTTIPKEEIISVKIYLGYYLQDATYKNTEIDVMLPIAGTSKKVLYTFRIEDKTNNVEVVRLGELTTPVPAVTTPVPAVTAKISFKLLSVKNVLGFPTTIISAPITTGAATPAAIPAPVAAANLALLRTWLSKRYPSITPNGKDVDEMIKDADSKMKTDASSSQWFSKNYDMKILDETDGADRLDKIHKRKENTGTKDFTATELEQIELVLQTMSGTMLSQLKEVRFVRQNGEKGKTNNNTAGETLVNGTDRTIILYDRMTLSDDTLFIGGENNSFVYKKLTQTIAHEMGHAVNFNSKANDTETKFNKYVAAHKITPITTYAKTVNNKVMTEFFPESFSLYHLDPVWMKTNVPELFKWFDEFTTTGNALDK